MAAKLTNLAGLQFGYLLVTSRVQETDAVHRLSSWNCVCTCGTRLVVRSDALRNGTKRSCGACKHQYQLRAIFSEIFDGSIRR